MKLRVAKKIVGGPRFLAYREGTYQRAMRRLARTKNGRMLRQTAKVLLFSFRYWGAGYSRGGWADGSHWR